MKTVLTLLAGAALLATPLAASAEGFGGHGGGHGGFAGGHAAAPAFHGGGARGGDFRGGGFRGGDFRGAGFAGAGFRGGYAPGYRGGYGYRGGWAVGAFLPALYWDAYLSDPFDYGLAAAPYGCHWVEVDGQALLINNANGAVMEVAPL